MQVFTKRICQSILETRDMYFSHICHFRPMTQPNPLKTQIFDPFPNQPNPTQPVGQPNPRTTLRALCLGHLSHWGRSVLKHVNAKLWLKSENCNCQLYFQATFHSDSKIIKYWNDLSKNCANNSYIYNSYVWWNIVLAQPKSWRLTTCVRRRRIFISPIAKTNYNTNIMCKHRGGFPERQSPIVLDTLSNAEYNIKY